MRLYAKVGEKQLANVVIKFNINLLGEDFTINPKAIVPTQLFTGEEQDTFSIAKFSLYDGGTIVEPKDLYSKCFKCGEMYPVDKLFCYSKQGLCLCEDHVEEFKEDRLVAKSLKSVLEKYYSKEKEK